MNKCLICSKSIQIEPDLKLLYDDIVQDQEYLRSIVKEQLENLRRYSWSIDPKFGNRKEVYHQDEILAVDHLITGTCDFDVSLMFCPDHYLIFSETLAQIKNEISKFDQLIENIKPQKTNENERIFRTMFRVFSTHYKQKMEFLLEKIDNLHLKYCMEVLSLTFVDPKNSGKVSDLFYSLRLNRIDYRLDVFKQYKEYESVVINPKEFYNKVGIESFSEYTEVRSDCLSVIVYISRYGYFYCSDDGLIIGDQFHTKYEDCLNLAMKIIRGK